MDSSFILLDQGEALSEGAHGLVLQTDVERSSMQIEKIFEKHGGDALHLQLLGRDIFIVRHPKYFTAVQKDTVRTQALMSLPSVFGCMRARARVRACVRAIPERTFCRD